MLENVKKVISLVEHITGIDYINMIYNEKKHRRELLIEEQINQEIAIKKEILGRENLTNTEQIALNSLWKKNLRKMQRQLEVMNIAIDNMDAKASIDNLDEDWLLDFFEKVSLISNNGMQLVWGKLLADASSDKNLCSKTLLNSLFLMGKEEILAFRNLTRLCVSEVGQGHNTEKIRSYPILFFRNNPDNYEACGITRRRLIKLQSLGLIEVDFNSDFVLKRKNAKLIYNNRIIEIYAQDKDKIKLGNVIFTYDGYLLYTFTEKVYNNSLLEYMLYAWKKRGYLVNTKKY